MGLQNFLLQQSREWKVSFVITATQIKKWGEITFDRRFGCGFQNTFVPYSDLI